PQHAQHFLGLGGLRESGETPEVAEEGADLAPMPREQLLALIARQKVGDLWRESRQLCSLPLDDLKQAHVLDRDDHVIRERLDQPDLRVVERADVRATEDDRANRYTLAKHRHAEQRPVPSGALDFGERVLGIGEDVQDLDGATLEERTTDYRPALG